MEWIERLNQILDFQVVVIGGSAITAKHILLFTVTLLITRYAARTTRRLLGGHLLTSVEPAPRYVILRITGYMVWASGILIALEFLSIDLTVLAVIAGGLGIGIGFGLQNVVANFVSGTDPLARATDSDPRSRYRRECRGQRRRHPLPLHHNRHQRQHCHHRSQLPIHQ